MINFSTIVSYIKLLFANSIQFTDEGLYMIKEITFGKIAIPTSLL